MGAVRHVWPLPNDLGDILRRYDKVIVPELNRGQMARLLRSEYLVDVESMSKVQGRPFTSSEIADKLREMIG